MPETATRCILFVDDEQNILSALKRELAPWARKRNIDLETRTRAADGLVFLGEKFRDTLLVVSDLRMPEMKGSDFLLAVRARWPDISTILLSGYSEAEELMKAVKSGISSYILKPWDPEYLLAEIEKALEARRIRDENKAYAKVIDEELKWAGELQKIIMKPSLRETGGIEFKSSWKPLERMYCGGDYYDVMNIGKRRFLVVIGDVAGHGVRAAIVTAILKSVIWPEYVHAADERRFSTSDFIGWLNGRITYELRNSGGLLVTFLAALIDLEAKTIRWTNAGQSEPLIVGKDGVRLLPGTGPALGFSDTVVYQEKTEPFSSGEIVFFHTDGLVEAGAKEKDAVAVDMKHLLSQIPYSVDWHRLVMAKCLEVAGMKNFEDDVAIVSAKFP